ncbi:MAG: ABC transporter permease [Propionibacteriaceae bacterium]|jgi:peptide/nickel transport system permease protein|nr:ABC transporter permease [Propionibacteriaceae bacterium]
MLVYVARRLAQVVPLLAVVTLAVFFALRLAPYDFVDSITTPNMTAEHVAIVRSRYGLDDPAWLQYLRWLGRVVQGDLGYSLASQHSIAADLAQRLPNTIVLVLPAYLTALILAIALGLVAAARHGRPLDRLIDTIGAVGIAMPPFWFALLLIYLFGYFLGLFPIIGMHTVGDRGLPDLLRHLFLPYLVLVVAFFPDLTRYVRSSAISQLDEDYVTVQRAFGASDAQLFRRHVSRNVLLPVVTQIGLALPMLVTGAVITETVFSWPGVGTYFLQGARALDYPVILAVLLLSATLVMVGNLLADVLYVVVDPRVRLGKTAT